MIGIEVNGEFLDLFPDTRINLKLINPIFGDNNIIPGSYTIPFDIPGGDTSPKNARILKNPDVIENPEARINQIATLYFDGVKYKKGTLSTVQAGKKRITCKFTFGIATISEDIKTTRITEICDESVVMASNSFTKQIYVECLVVPNAADPSTTSSITINGTTYEATDQSIGGVVKINGEFIAVPGGGADIATTNKAFVIIINDNTDDPRVFAANSGSGFTIQPLYNPGVLESVLTLDFPKEQATHWDIDASTFEDAYNNSIITFLNNYLSATPADDRIRFPMKKNLSLYKDEKIKYRFGFFDFNLINYNYAGSYVLNKVKDSSNSNLRPFNRTSVAPAITLKWVLEEIATYFGIDYEGDFFDDPDYPKIVFEHSNTLDIRIPFIGSVDWIATRRSFNVNEFIPNLTVTDLLKAIQSCINVAIYLNEKTGALRFQLREPILDSTTAEDITPLCSPTPGPNLEVEEGIRLERTTDSNELTAIADVFEVGTSSKKIEMKVNSLFVLESTKVSPDIGIGAASALSFELPLSKRSLDTGIPLTFIFYALKNNGTFNYATANIHLADGDFTLPGANGLALKRWKSFLTFLLNRKSIPVDIDYQIRHLIDIDWEKKYTFDRVKYLINSLDVTFTMRGVESTRAELYTTGLGVLP